MMNQFLHLIMQQLVFMSLIFFLQQKLKLILLLVLPTIIPFHSLETIMDFSRMVLSDKMLYEFVVQLRQNIQPNDLGEIH